MTTTYNFTNHDLVLADVGASPAKRYEFKVRDLPHEDRPREKLERYGPGILSTAELVAVLLTTGTKKEEVLSMAQRIVKDYGERSLAGQRNPSVLSRELGIPMNKAMQIVACAELGRRFYERPVHGPAVIRTAHDVYEYAVDMRRLPKEHLRGLYLNAHHRVIHDEVLSIGTIDGSLIHPREVFKPAIEYGAVAVVLVHNHPSGIVTPSEADIAVTTHLAEAGKVVGVPLVDHVIVGSEGYASIEIEY